MKIDEVLQELGIDPKKCPKGLKVRSIGKRTTQLMNGISERHLLVTLQFDADSDVDAKKLAKTKYGISHYQDRNDRYVWYVDFLRVYVNDAPVSKVR